MFNDYETLISNTMITGQRRVDLWPMWYDFDQLSVPCINSYRRKTSDNGRVLLSTDDAGANVGKTHQWTRSDENGLYQHEVGRE